MRLNEALWEMYNEVEVAREQAHYDAMNCIEKHDWDGLDRARKSGKGYFDLIITIIHML